MTIASEVDKLISESQAGADGMQKEHEFLQRCCFPARPYCFTCDMFGAHDIRCPVGEEIGRRNGWRP